MATLTILPALDTPHLILREMQDSDAVELAGFVTQTRFQKYISHRLRDQSEVAAFVQRHLVAQGDPRRRIFHLVAEEYMSAEVVGDAFAISHGKGGYEIGWGVHPALWRMGFGTEIAQALLSLTFEHLDAEFVWCKIMRPNIASLRLAESIGMKKEQSHQVFPVGLGRVEAVDVFKLTQEQYFDLPY